MIGQTTLATEATTVGVGLHTNQRCRVTLHPAPADHGRRVVPHARPEAAREVTWAARVPSIMSTSVVCDDGTVIRTVEHLMAALSAYGVDNVRIEVDGPELPIFDGSARPWCQLLDRAGLVSQPAACRVVRVLKPVQVFRQNGFLRIEPADAFSIDVTYSLVASLPVMRWAGIPTRETFLAELARARSFGSLDWRKLLGRLRARRGTFRGRPRVSPHTPDWDLVPLNPRPLLDRLDQAIAAHDAREPVLRGARPGRAAFVVGRAILPWPRFRDEPVRHVALDMIGDLALAGAPLIGRVVAHNPSHEKTYLLVAALMDDRSAWTIDSLSAAE